MYDDERAHDDDVGDDDGASVMMMMMMYDAMMTSRAGRAGVDGHGSRRCRGSMSTMTTGDVRYDDDVRRRRRWCDDVRCRCTMMAYDDDGAYPDGEVVVVSGGEVVVVKCEACW